MEDTRYGMTLWGKKFHRGVLNANVGAVDTVCGNQLFVWSDELIPWVDPTEYCMTCFRKVSWRLFLNYIQTDGYNRWQVLLD